MTWTFVPRLKRMPKLKDPVFIEGLPGIGNVGKIAVDFIIEKTGARLLYDITSDSMPHSVFVVESNLVEMPKIQIFYRKRPQGDLLLLTGDLQPQDEASCHQFCRQIISLCQEYGVKQIITTGGIGLQEIQKVPRVYCTGSSEEFVRRYSKGTGLERRIYGVVGPIVGATGLLVGYGGKAGLPAVALLAETISHPLYLGVTGARELLKVLTKKHRLQISLKTLDNEIKRLEGELVQKTKELSQISKETALKRIEGKFGKEVTYIG